MEKYSPEGRNTITNRKLQDYCANLEIESSFLAGKKVLNFGCGGSNLKKDMEKLYPDIQNVSEGFFDVDVEYDPIGSHGDSLCRDEELLRPKIQRRRNVESRSPQLVFQEVHDHENEIFGIEGRGFIQANGVSLPFADSSFDVCVALWATYQIPEIEQRDVFNELIRVADVLHFGPVDGSDLTDIENACMKYDSTIISVTSFQEYKFLRLSTIQDYVCLYNLREAFFKPQYAIETDTDNGVLNANSNRTARVIVVRNNFLNI